MRSIASHRPNAQINIATPGSLPVRIAAAMRRRMFDRFLSNCRPAPTDTVLDVGATSDTGYEASNYLEAWYPYRNQIIAAGLDDVSHLPSTYSGVRALRADGRQLPFPDQSFDLVHASAVIEHVGNRIRQGEFLNELFRVARRSVFLTTPNRWYPIEFHTLLPFAHWLPTPIFHRVCHATGRSAFADESVLNLLDAAALARLSEAVELGECRIEGLRLLGLTSNWLVTIHRHRP